MQKILTPETEHGIKKALDVLGILLDFSEDAHEHEPTPKQVLAALSRLHADAFDAHLALSEALDFMESPMGRRNA
tara:strand:- start:41 stop:265 length:225 start_codon:yes stop_codon:yes gene_type:complete